MKRTTHANDESNKNKQANGTNKQLNEVYEYSLFQKTFAQVRIFLVLKKAPTNRMKLPNIQAANTNKQPNEVCEYFEYTLCQETQTNNQLFHLVATNIRSSVKNYDANDEYTC